MRLLIAIKENEGIKSKLSEHFGHCPFFAIYETEDKKLEIIKNNIDHSNHNLTPVDQTMRFSPDTIFTLGIGQRAIRLFDEKGVKIKTGDYQTVEEVINNIDKLKDLEGGCVH